MKAVIKKKWIKALRSGNYKQGLSFLKVDNKYCCLGVLTDIYAREKGVSFEECLLDEFDASNNRTLSQRVMKWAGIKHTNPICFHPERGITAPLSRWNDALKVDFKGIANLIQRNKI